MVKIFKAKNVAKYLVGNQVKLLHNIITIISKGIICGYYKKKMICSITVGLRIS